MEKSDSSVISAWKDPSDVGGYKGLFTFARNKGIKNLKRLEKELSKISGFSRHRKNRTHYKRVPIILKGPGALIQIDIGDFLKLKYSNSHFAYLLFGIDCFTKKGFLFPMKKKNEDEVLKAMKAMIDFYGPIENIQSDQDRAFYAKKVRDYLKAQGINHYSSKSNLKAQTVSNH